MLVAVGQTFVEWMLVLARYGNAWLVEFFFDSCYSQGVTGCHMATWSGNT